MRNIPAAAAQALQQRPNLRKFLKIFDVRSEDQTQSLGHISMREFEKALARLPGQIVGLGEHAGMPA